MFISVLYKKKAGEMPALTGGELWFDFGNDATFF